MCCLNMINHRGQLLVCAVKYPGVRMKALMLPCVSRCVRSPLSTTIKISPFCRKHFHLSDFLQTTCSTHPTLSSRPKSKTKQLVSQLWMQKFKPIGSLKLLVRVPKFINGRDFPTFKQCPDSCAPVEIIESTMNVSHDPPTLRTKLKRVPLIFARKSNLELPKTLVVQGLFSVQK